MKQSQHNRAHLKSYPSNPHLRVGGGGGIGLAGQLSEAQKQDKAGSFVSRLSLRNRSLLLQQKPGSARVTDASGVASVKVSAQLPGADGVTFSGPNSRAHTNYTFVV